MRLFTRLTLTFVFFMIAGIVSAQTPFGPPDDRYAQRVEGQLQYPASLVPHFNRAPTPAELAACAASKPYEPGDTHLFVYTNRVKIARIRIQETDECTGMRSAAGDALIRRIKGTKVAVDELGRDLFDFGSPDGPICGNPRMFSIPVNMPAVLPPPPPAPIPPPPAPWVPRVRPTPPPTRMYNPPRPRPQVKTEDGPSLTLGAGIVFGSIHTDYTYPDPSRGDVPQRNNFASPVLIARFDQASNHGIFAEVSTTFLGKTSTKEYEDRNGVWNSKKRDTDDSRDTALNLKAGYKFGLGNAMSVGASVDFDHFCLCEKYFAQNTNTETQRSFQTMGLGVEATGASTRVTVRVNGTLGLTGHRNKWTTQTYNGPPASITFPKVTDEEQPAKLNRIGVMVDMQVMGPVHAFGNVQYSHWASNRPTAHPATSETTSSLATTVGVSIKWGG